MENKTSEELRSSHSIHVLESLRNTLWLQFGRMSSVWRDHNPGDGNVNTGVLARLGDTRFLIGSQNTCDTQFLAKSLEDARVI